MTPASPGSISSRDSFQFWFTKSAGLILLITGAAKIVSSLGSSKVLVVPDPVFHVPFAWLMLFAGIIELGVAYFCFSKPSTGIPAVLVLWVSTMLLGYRIGLGLIGWRAPCHCLGNLTDALRLSPETADTLMKWILGYLATGSYLCFAQRLFSRPARHNIK